MAFKRHGDSLEVVVPRLIPEKAILGPMYSDKGVEHRERRFGL
jgi:hypothetical protein